MMLIFPVLMLYSAVCHMEPHRFFLSFISINCLINNLRSWWRCIRFIFFLLLDRKQFFHKLITENEFTDIWFDFQLAGYYKSTTEKFKDCWSFCCMFSSTLPSFFSFWLPFYSLCNRYETQDFSLGKIVFVDSVGFPTSGYIWIWTMVWSGTQSTRFAGEVIIFFGSAICQMWLLYLFFTLNLHVIYSSSKGSVVNCGLCHRI